MLLKRIEGKEKLKEQFANATADPGIKYFALKFRCVRSRQLTMVSNYVKKKKDDDGHIIQEPPIPPTTSATDANQKNNDSTLSNSKVYVQMSEYRYRHWALEKEPKSLTHLSHLSFHLNWRIATQRGDKEGHHKARI